MENSSDHKNNSHHSTPVEEDEDQGLLCKFQEVNIIKTRSSDDDHHQQDSMINGHDDEEDGFKTPTKSEHRLKVDLTCPPPAPMKPKSRLMKRRRPSRRPLFQVSSQEFELIFAPHSSPSKDNNNVDISVDSSGNIKKVNHPNLPTLMSFR
ncbi:Cyclin-dependent protein kinase inhibitor SMR12 [Bienertia sinuspersici]